MIVRENVQPYEIDGKRTATFPVPAFLDRAKPIYEGFPGWQCEIGDVECLADLPQQAREYVRLVEKLIGVPVGLVSVGPHREEMFRLPTTPA